jgi:hypothetical protein
MDTEKLRKERVAELIKSHVNSTNWAEELAIQIDALYSKPPEGARERVVEKLADNLYELMNSDKAKYHWYEFGIEWTWKNLTPYLADQILSLIYPKQTEIDYYFCQKRIMHICECVGCALIGKCKDLNRESTAKQKCRACGGDGEIGSLPAPL